MDLPRFINPNRFRATQHVERQPTVAEVRSIEQLRRQRVKREFALVDRFIAEIK